MVSIFRRQHRSYWEEETYCVVIAQAYVRRVITAATEAFALHVEVVTAAKFAGCPALLQARQDVYGRERRERERGMEKGK